MKLEILLPLLNEKKVKDKVKEMNINSDCIITNQVGKYNYKEFNYRNNKIKVLETDLLGTGKNRNTGLLLASSDIILFSDDDIVYCDNYKELVINEFKKNKKADVIFFNLNNINNNREIKLNKKNKRVRFYNSLRYGTCRIAVRKKSIDRENIWFSLMFGGNCKYSNGEDTLFIVECLKKKLKLYSSTINIGKVDNKTSTWFKGYDKRFFFNRGVLFYNVNKKIFKFLCLQYLIRHKNILKTIKFNQAYKYMKDGKKAYKKNNGYDEYYRI